MPQSSENFLASVRSDGLTDGVYVPMAVFLLLVLVLAVIVIRTR